MKPRPIWFDLFLLGAGCAMLGITVFLTVVEVLM
jgi:hypothetical protein